MVAEGSAYPAPEDMEYAQGFSEPQWESLWNVGGYDDLPDDPDLADVNLRLVNLNRPREDLVLVDVPNRGQRRVRLPPGSGRAGRRPQDAAAALARRTLTTILTLTRGQATMKWLNQAATAGVLLVLLPIGGACQTAEIEIPQLTVAPTIDGHLDEWREAAYTGGWWDIERLSQTPWYDPARNRLTIHPAEVAGEIDLQARYYVAWDEEYLYLGAEARDNINDVVDPEPEDKRWYYKDCVCWFIEAPRDSRPESFETGDNAFCFLIDTTHPAYGAWWRHGEPGRAYVEEPLPAGTFDYELQMNPWGRSPADFSLEARVRMDPLFSRSDPDWAGASVGQSLGLEIVHTDPDGGDYGGHFLVYGSGDDDSTWGEAVLGGPRVPTAIRDSTWGTAKPDSLPGE